MMRKIWTAVTVVFWVEGFTRCAPEYYWMWRMIGTISAALLAVAWADAKGEGK